MKALGWKQIVLALASFTFVAACLILIKVMPLDAVSEMIHGSMGTASGWNETLKQATPLLIAGLAVYVALRAGLFNIGAEGQLMMGALCATAVALNVTGILGILLAIVAGTIAGALWAWPAGLIKAYRNGHEVITTIMLNNVAAFLSAWVIAGPLKSSIGLTTSTERVSESVWMPSLISDPPFHLNLVVVLAVVLVGVTAWWMRRTVAGFELSATGANPKAAA
ncbi:MAG TPA: hypothetical protein VNI20_07050, partial [Fimbriimonadaceae bacterium]|nr:hypothetical protein [Fimbriimonadaceae bacterium]